MSSTDFSGNKNQRANHGMEAQDLPCETIIVFPISERLDDGPVQHN